MSRFYMMLSIQWHLGCRQLDIHGTNIPFCRENYLCRGRQKDWNANEESIPRILRRHAKHFPRRHILWARRIIASMTLNPRSERAIIAGFSWWWTWTSPTCRLYLNTFKIRKTLNVNLFLVRGCKSFEVAGRCWGGREEFQFHCSVISHLVSFANEVRTITDITRVV